MFACKILLCKEFCAAFSLFPKQIPWASPHVTAPKFIWPHQIPVLKEINFLQISLTREIKHSLANVMVEHTNLSYLVQPALLNEAFFPVFGCLN